MSYQVVETHRETGTVAVLCAASGVSVSGCYAWHKRPVSRREQSNQTLLGHNRAAHQV